MQGKNAGFLRKMWQKNSGEQADCLKMETDETVPDIRQAKRLSVLYHTSLDDLIDFDIDVKEIQDIIDRTSEETEKKIN